MEVETPVADNPTTETPVEDWRSSVPSELRYNDGGVDALAKFESPGQVAKSYLELQKTMGNRVKLPDENSSDEERSAFYQKVGRPEKADGYTMPEGSEINAETIAPVMAAAHKAGVSNQAFGAIVAEYLNLESQISEQNQATINAETDAAEQQLKADWAGQYDANIEIIERVFRQNSTDETRDVIKQKFNDAGLGRDPVVLNWLKDIGTSTLNDTIVKGEQPKPLDKDYKPKYVNSPEMYRNAEGPDGTKAREWFTQNKGYEY